ncbi:hypothetical protein PHMEG_00027769 [Phytophthora megakarya]|uniref:Ubiquitin-like protease family profile domain-containing protein n=1 Tax=Phytophthora megakarya TaxID=4795 RepID=A0A225V936_9STRA|nr:hypothetical protein PHMEG_00027769 [Phytophthora megakarya]
MIKREYVPTATFDYNFVIPQNLVTKLSAVVEEEKLKRQMSKYFNSLISLDQPEGTTEEITAYVPGGTPHFTSGDVYNMVEYYNVVRQFKSWLADVKWLQSTRWEENSSNPEPFDAETDSKDLAPDVVGSKHQQLAFNLIKVLEGVSLESTFCLQSEVGTVKMENLVGYVARDRMFSDTIIDFYIRCICSELGYCYALDSYAPVTGCPLPHDTRLSRTHYLVLPTPAITQYFYEPLCNQSYRGILESTFEDIVVRSLTDWHDATMAGTDYPLVENAVWIEAPKQPDGTSCGVLIIGQVYSMLKDSLRFTRAVITADDVAIMRLRIM